MAGQSDGLSKRRNGNRKPTGDKEKSGLSNISDEALLELVRSTLDRLLEPPENNTATDLANHLLTSGTIPSEIDREGLRALLYQMTRNADPEMQANHLTELRMAAALSHVAGRRIDFERQASGRNDRRVDFGVDDGLRQALVEVKNLNAPLIKKATDPFANNLRQALQGAVQSSDIHLTYLFFRRPHFEQLQEISIAIKERWREHARGTEVFLTPKHRARMAAVIVPARPDTGGRVIVYDHGKQLQSEPGSRIHVVHNERRQERSPRQLMLEMFVKDNILRRLQDAEHKFPIAARDDIRATASGDGELDTIRVVLFCQGEWAPVSHVDRYLDEAVYWYVNGEPSSNDIWAEYYRPWAARWSFAPLHNIDAILAVRPRISEEPAPHADASQDTPHDAGSRESDVRGGDVDFSVRSVYARRAGLIERIFEGA